MEEILSKLGNSVYSIAERLVFAIIIAVVGAILVKLVKRIFKRKNSLIKIDPTVRRFVHNFSTSAAGYAKTIEKEWIISNYQGAYNVRMFKNWF